MLRQYEGELNRVVARADDEIARIDSHYLTDGEMVARYGPNPTQCVKCGFVWSR